MKNENLRIEYILVRSNRKTVALKIDKELQVVVLAPLKLPQKYIDDFVTKHIDWIEKHLASARTREAIPRLQPTEIEQLYKSASEYIPDRVKFFSDQMGVCPRSIKITEAHTIWGSCIFKFGICFSYRIMLL